jgi:hypothetical protein
VCLRMIANGLLIHELVPPEPLLILSRWVGC